MFETNVRQDAVLQDVIRNEIHAILEKRFMNKNAGASDPKLLSQITSSMSGSTQSVPNDLVRVSSRNGLGYHVGLTNRFIIFKLK